LPSESENKDKNPPETDPKASPPPPTDLEKEGLEELERQRLEAEKKKKELETSPKPGPQTDPEPGKGTDELLKKIQALTKELFDKINELKQHKDDEDALKQLRTYEVHLVLIIQGFRDLQNETMVQLNELRKYLFRADYEVLIKKLNAVSDAWNVYANSRTHDNAVKEKFGQECKNEKPLEILQWMHKQVVVEENFEKYNGKVKDDLWYQFFKDAGRLESIIDLCIQYRYTQHTGGPEAEPSFLRRVITKTLKNLVGDKEEGPPIYRRKKRSNF